MPHKNNWDYLIFTITKTIGSIVMFSILKSLLFNTQNVTAGKRKILLFIIFVIVVLNVLGVYRNSFTLWKYQDLASYLWLGLDIVQLMFYSILYMAVYKKETFSNKVSIVMLSLLIAFLVLNSYNFFINFSYFKYEGLIVFLFWFINNASMMASSLLLGYIALMSGKNITVQ